MNHNENEIEIDKSGRVPFKEAFRFWVKLGFISFGGPAGQIAIMHRELVDKRRWLSDERFLHALNYCMLLPGPEAQQLAIYIGWLMHRVWGGIVAGAFFVLPSMFILMVLSYIYAAYGNVGVVASVLAGVKPIVVAIVVEAVMKIGGRALKRLVHFFIAALAFVSIYFLHVPFPLIVLAAAVVGFIGVRAMPEAFASLSKPVSPDKEDTSNVPTVIDDHAPPPAHTIPNRKRTFAVLAVGVLLWLLPFAAIALRHGPDGIHAGEYVFFTQAAFVTFGGAYAVLAYVTQAAPAYGWMSSAQVVDGLALAETTPGPLIMVLQFVGFMAAWNNPGTMDQTSAAILGGLITTYVTFLPCFIFIFVGAPYIEVLRGNNDLTAALTGVTAAVVGVILNLALVFGATVILQAGDVNWLAALLTVVAFVLLYRFKVNMLLVIAMGAAFGLLSELLMR